MYVAPYLEKVLIIAPILSLSGYGVQSRFIVDALATRPDLYDLHVHPLSWGNSSWLLEDSHKEKFYKFLINKKETYQGSYDISLQVTVPSEWQNAATINITIPNAIKIIIINTLTTITKSTIITNIIIIITRY